MKNEDELEQLYLLQLSSGCDKIKCKNVYCARCSDFIYSKRPNFRQQDIQETAKELAKSHGKSPRLCETTRLLLFDQGFRELQAKIEVCAKSDNISGSEISVDTVRSMFKSQPVFSNVLRANQQPLSLANSAIDDDFFFEFSTKISKIQEIETDVLGGLYMTARSCLDTKRFFDYYLNFRSFLIMFYFPTILSPDISPPVVAPLMKKLSQVKKKHLVQTFVSWVSKLTNLRRQMVGYIHSAISLYYSEHPNANPHSETLHVLMKAMGMLKMANCESECPLPVSTFYDDHINESINIENELDLLSCNNKHGRFASILKKSPFILSLKTKALICQCESKNIMHLMAQHSMMLSTQSHYTTESYLTLKIRRSNLIKDAVEKLSHQDSNSFLKKLKIVFEGESAIDVGGPSREFLYLISEKLFSPDYGMFVIVNEKYNWFSQCSFESERSFFLIGAVVGLAIHNSVLLPIRFPIVLYKRLLAPDKKLTINDLREIDPVAAASLKALRDTRDSKGGDVRDAMMDFTITITSFDAHEELPLVEGLPKETEVTNENLDLYINSYLEFVLVKGIKKQFEAFRKGFDTTCRAPSYRLFEPEEMDILVSGVEVLDWGALQRNTSYIDGYKETSKQVKWFWEVFQNFTKEEKLKFLKFATGTDRAPIGGLGSLKLVIQRIKDSKKLPISHTCFNTFALPMYTSKTVLEEKVKLAIQYTEGFGIK